VIRRRTDPVTQLGYATQLVTVRAIGTFQPDPAAVPEPVVAAVAHQLGIDDPGALTGYRDMPVRWRHTAEIRDRYGYRDFATQPGRFAFTVWLCRQAWAGEVASSVLFRAAHRQLLARRILLPGHSVLMRLVATVRERATHRSTAVWRERPARSCGPSWRSSCWCPRDSAAPNWTCCGARHSRPRSPAWCALSTADLRRRNQRPLPRHGIANSSGPGGHPRLIHRQRVGHGISDPQARADHSSLPPPNPPTCQGISPRPLSGVFRPPPARMNRTLAADSHPAATTRSRASDR
jgi:uncharacterized protein DUF4158